MKIVHQVIEISLIEKRLKIRIIEQSEQTILNGNGDQPLFGVHSSTHEEDKK